MCGELWKILYFLGWITPMNACFREDCIHWIKNVGKDATSSSAKVTRYNTTQPTTQPPPSAIYTTPEAMTLAYCQDDLSIDHELGI